jgi:sugar lactone lactonase YvrE
VVVDASSGIWIADSLQHRILYFANDGDTVADRVLGQAGSFTTGAVNANGGPGPETFSLPQGLALDAAGQLYVSDTGNNRVLVIPGG